MRPSPKLIRAAAVGLSLALFAAALFLPVAVGTVGRDTPYHQDGYQILLLGWLGPLMLHFGWYANPLLPVLWVQVAMGARARWLVPTAVVAHLLAWSSVVTLPTFGLMGRNEGEAMDVHGFGAGCFLWLAAFAVPVLARLAERRVFRAEASQAEAT